MDVLQWSRHYRCFPGQGGFDLTGFAAARARSRVPRPAVARGLQRCLPPGRRRTHRDRRHALADHPGGSLPSRASSDVRSQTAAAGRLAACPPRPPLPGYAFVELAVDPLAEPVAEHLLRGLGFARTGLHRTKPVQLWQQADARVLLNRTGAARGARPRGDAVVSAIAVESGDPGRSARRARALLAPPIPAPSARRGRPVRGRRPRRHLGVLLSHRRATPRAGSATSGPSRPTGPATARCSPRVDHVALSQPFDYFDEAALFYRSVLGLRPHREPGDRDRRTGWSAAVRSAARAVASGWSSTCPLLGGGRLPETADLPACRVRLLRHLRRRAGNAVKGIADAADARQLLRRPGGAFRPRRRPRSRRCANSECCTTATAAAASSSTSTA